jgi:zinc/manganese transport system substrate-binding protein
MKIRWTAVAAAVATASVASAALAGCGQDDPAAGGPGPIQVVASTNVWASVASAVGGTDVEVTAIISDPAGDPHSYQMTPRDAAALTGADVVVFNGGGYDEFVEQALGESGADGPRTVEAVALAEEDEHESAEPSTSPADEHAHGENEHVWYRLPTVAAVADELAARLGEVRPESKASFQANAQSFRGRLDELNGRVDQIAQAHPGTAVAATEPIAHYLLDAAALQDVTPPEFVEAIEEETDPPAAAVAEIQSLVAERRVAVLVHNPQTETPVVSDVLTKAREAGLPVVEMTETLPAGQDYVTWMTEQIEALSSALKQR